MITNNSQLPLSTGPISGILHIREKDKKPLTWELYVGGSTKYGALGITEKELEKLPNYPVTHKILHEGIGVTLCHNDDSTLASFHGFDLNNRYKHRHFYIGSRGYHTWPNCRNNTKNYQKFLSKTFGISIGKDNRPIKVKIEFLAESE
jgi:hypothetical protein